MKILLFLLPCLILSAASGFANSDPVTYPNNVTYNLIANPLDDSLGNHLNSIIHNNVVPPLPDGCCLSKWLNGNSVPVWEQSVYSVAQGWVPNNTLAPGEGAFLFNPSGGPFTITFAGNNLGQRTTPVSFTSGFPYLLGAQGDSPSCVNFEAMTDITPPGLNTKVYAWDGVNYNLFTYANSKSGANWSPSDPSICVGHSVWVYPFGVNTQIPQPPACTACPAPVNDDCANAIQVHIGSPAFCGTTVCATPSTTGSIPPPCGGSDNAGDVWFTFTPLCDGLVTIDTCGLCSGQSLGFATVLSVYKGTCGAGNLTEVYCISSDPSPPAGCNALGVQSSRATFQGNPSITYYIRVAGVGMASGEFRLNITAPTPPPDNDECIGAIAVFVGSPAACGTTECANKSAAGIIIPTPGGNSKNSPDVWYTFTPPCGGLVTIDTCGTCPGLPGTFNTVLSVYTGVCGSPLHQVVFNNNATGACSPQSRVQFTGAPGVMYYIRVAGSGPLFGATAAGRFRLNIGLVVPTTVPINDSCAGAQLIPNSGTYPFNTCLATDDLNPTPTCPNHKNVWFYYEPNCDGEVWVNTCGSSFDTVLEVYSGADCNNLVYVDCNDNASAGPCVGQKSFLTFTAALGTRYYIRVGGATVGDSGAGKLTVQGPFPSGPMCSPVIGTPPFFSRLFQIMGPANGTDWSWSIGMSCCVNIEDQDVPGVTHTVSVNNVADRNALAANFVTSINNACPSQRLQAFDLSTTTTPGLMLVKAISCNNNSTPFVFRVGGQGPITQQNQCVVANGNGLPTSGLCSFNPEILELPLSDHDFNTNGVDDAIDIMLGTSADVDGDGIPDEADPCLAPEPTAEPESQAVQLGTNITFSVAATGTAPLSYQWSLAGMQLADSGSVSGATSNVLSIQNVALADLGDYTVTISNACDAITTAAANLSLDTLVPVILHPVHVNGSFGFAFAAKLGVVYKIEYADDLSNPSWTELETVTGYGQEVDVADSPPLPTARFYRVRPLPQ